MISFLPFLLIFLFGLTLGSFLNCLIYRFEIGAPHQLLFKSEGGLARSYCPHCKHILSWKDLIPVFSFMILKGKCRYCKKPISWQYPLVELTTAILFLAIFNYLSKARVGDEGGAFSDLHFSFFIFIIACFLIIIFFYDLKHYIIPDKIIYPAIGTTFIYNILNSYFVIHNSYSIVNSLEAAFIVSAFFLAIILFSRGKWMGLGDVKLAFFMGLFLGFPNILFALFLAFSIGAIIGVGLIISGKKTLKSEVPFGPFLVTGTFLAMFWGERIINWYLTLI